MNRKVCVITGANRGLGKSMALGIASLNYELVLVCRNIGEANQVKKEITSQTGNNGVRIIKADLSSMQELIAAANEIRSLYRGIDVLINNAAVFRSSLSFSKDGYEEQYAVNYLAVYALTLELVDLLKRSEDPRVVNIGSNMHRYGSPCFSSPVKNSFYNGVKQYANTKLAVMMFTFEFARRYQNIRCNVFHPGSVNTEIGTRYSHGIYKYGWSLINKFFTPATMAAKAGVCLACSDEVAGQSGLYFYRNKIAKPSSRSGNKEMSEKLWNETENRLQKLKLRFHEQKVQV